jgi:putative copper export protein
MSYFYLIFPCFNILLGTMMALVGFKIYKPSTDEKTLATYDKFSWLLKIAGIAILFYGVLTVLIDLKAIN